MLINHSYPALVDRSLLVELNGDILRSDEDDRLSFGESLGVASELESSGRGCNTVTCLVGDFREDLSASCFMLLTRCKIFGGLLPRFGYKLNHINKFVDKA